MRLFSDFRLFERPPKPGLALFRWIAWRWLMLGILFVMFVAVFAASYYIGGQPVYFTNEQRYLSEPEVRSQIWPFLSGGGAFLLLGLAGVVFLPKASKRAK